MASRKRREKMKDPLDELRPVYIPIDVIDPEDATLVFEQLRKEEDEKYFPLLFERYRVNVGDYRELVRAMAREHIKGFQYRKQKSGNTRDLKEARRLIGWVEKELKDGAPSKFQAFGRLVEAGAPYEDHEDHEDPEGALQKRYARAFDYLADAGYDVGHLSPNQKQSLTDQQIKEHAEARLTALKNDCYNALMWELEPPNLNLLKDIAETGVADPFSNLVHRDK